MRTLTIVSGLALLFAAGPALAQSGPDIGNPTHNGVMAYGQTHTASRPMIRDVHRRHALGSLRHPTVGNTANQRVNGG